ncbi:MAG: dipeptidyl aminopeptidase, partial [Terrimicrobiaceae bacterium]
MNIWDEPALWRAPKISESAPSGIDGVKALFYEGLPWNGRPTRVFTYLGLPEIRSGDRVPGMVI